LKVPDNYYNYRGSRGPIAVNRDDGSSAVSDWFVICGLDNASAGSKVILAVDNSGSMTTDTVRSSYNLFLAKCAAAGIAVTQVSMGSGIVGILSGRNENWVTPFFIDV
jgi:urocanate hydratase